MDGVTIAGKKLNNGISTTFQAVFLGTMVSTGSRTGEVTMTGPSLKTEPFAQAGANSANSAEVHLLVTAEDVVNALLRTGVSLDQIRIPGHGKEDILFLPDNFDDPIEGFEDY